MIQKTAKAMETEKAAKCRREGTTKKEILNDKGKGKKE
jgi:hypothetical protein